MTPWDKVKLVVHCVISVEKRLSALEEAEFEDEGALEMEMISVRSEWVKDTLALLRSTIWKDTMFKVSNLARSCWVRKCSMLQTLI